MKIFLGPDPVDMNCQDMYFLSLLNKPYCHKPDQIGALTWPRTAGHPKDWCMWL